MKSVLDCIFCKLWPEFSTYHDVHVIFADPVPTARQLRMRVDTVATILFTPKELVDHSIAVAGARMNAIHSEILALRKELDKVIVYI